MKHRLAFLLLVLLTSVFLNQSAFGAISGKDILTGRSIEVVPGEKGTVVLFMSAKCPCSNSHVEGIRKVSSKFKGFTFVAVHSNFDENLDDSKNYFSTKNLPFQVIEDDAGKLANEFKAFKTPHAFVLSPNGKILYKGGVTNSSNGVTASKHFLEDALSDITANRQVKVAEGRTLGCVIARGDKHAW